MKLQPYAYREIIFRGIRSSEKRKRKQSLKTLSDRQLTVGYLCFAKLAELQQQVLITKVPVGNGSM